MRYLKEAVPLCLLEASDWLVEANQKLVTRWMHTDRDAETKRAINLPMRLIFAAAPFAHPVLDAAYCCEDSYVAVRKVAWFIERIDSRHTCKGYGFAGLRWAMQTFEPCEECAESAGRVNDSKAIAN